MNQHCANSWKSQGLQRVYSLMRERERPKTNTAGGCLENITEKLRKQVLGEMR